MRKILILLLVSFGGLAQTVHRVVNGDNLQTKIDNAAAGDVILVEAGVYGDVTINKKLDLYGTGYFLNSSNTSYIGTSTIGNVYFAPGSKNSKIQGFITNEINCGAGFVNILKNRIVGYTRIGAMSNGYPVTANNVLLKQNINLKGVYTYTPSINFVIKNNIIFDRLYCDSRGFGNIINNTCISGNMELVGVSPNVQYKNNIFTPLSAGSPIPFIVEYNTATNDLGFLSPSNKGGVNLNSLFLGYPTNPNNLQEDARYQLAPNSPAKGAGEGGTDAGAFGGDDPYVLSGIPNIPSIYQLTVPAQVPQNGTLNVTIKAKTNN